MNRGALNCCGITTWGGFPYDTGTAYDDAALAKLQEQLAGMGDATCHLVALNEKQAKAGDLLIKHGWEMLGQFDSTHGDGTTVTLYAKGQRMGTMKKRVAEKKAAVKSVKSRLKAIKEIDASHEE